MDQAKCLVSACLSPSKPPKQQAAEQGRQCSGQSLLSRKPQLSLCHPVPPALAALRFAFLGANSNSSGTVQLQSVSKRGDSGSANSNLLSCPLKALPFPVLKMLPLEHKFIPASPRVISSGSLECKRNPEDLLSCSGVAVSAASSQLFCSWRSDFRRQIVFEAQCLEGHRQGWNSSVALWRLAGRIGVIRRGLAAPAALSGGCDK